MSMVKRRVSKNQTPGKVKINFDVPLLNVLIRYLRCEYVSRTSLMLLRKFVSFIDVEAYKYEEAIYPRVKTLVALCGIMIERGIQDESVIRTALADEYPEGILVLDKIGFEKNGLGTTECDYITQAVKSRVQTIVLCIRKQEIIDNLEALDATAFSNDYVDIVKTVRKQMSDLICEIMATEEDDQGMMKEFAFSLPNAADLIDKIVTKAKRPASVLQTGIRYLNSILAPGFQSSRMYCFLGGSGKFKSGTLINIADQIRRFNPQIPAIENGLRKCILFITLENGIEETVERIYDMYCNANSSFRDDSASDVIEVLREKGGYNFTNDSGIDIYMKYAGNLEINTGEIHGYMRELREKGYAPICIILDYIKRIDSVRNSDGDERLRMSYVAKELKAIAQYYEIPLITAMQLNREGNGILDNAVREAKQDVARFVGSSSIGNAWDIIEDSDWVCLINPEIQIATGKKFLTFKRLKIRSKSEQNADGTITEYFNHPFSIDHGIRLETDVDKDESLSIVTLSCNLETIEEREDDEKEEKKKRPSLNDLKNQGKGRVLATLGVQIANVTNNTPPPTSVIDDIDAPPLGVAC